MFGPFAYAQPAIAVKSVEVSPQLPPTTPGSNEMRAVRLTAAPDGIVAKILSLIGLGKTTTLEITNQRITRVDLGSTVQDTAVLPISNVASIHYGRSKPVALLIMGIFFAIPGLIGTVTVGPAGMTPLVLAAVFLGIYFTSGITYTMFFASSGGLGVSLKLKTKDPAELDKVCEVVNALVHSTANGGTSNGISRPRGAFVDAQA